MISCIYIKTNPQSIKTFGFKHKFEYKARVFMWSTIINNLNLFDQKENINMNQGYIIQNKTNNQS